MCLLHNALILMSRPLVELCLVQVVHLGCLTIHLLQTREDLKIICACLASNVGNKHDLKKVAMGGTASPDFPFPHHALCIWLCSICTPNLCLHIGRLGIKVYLNVQEITLSCRNITATSKLRRLYREMHH
jgi:hypothetical protein